MNVAIFCEIQPLVSQQKSQIRLTSYCKTYTVLVQKVGRPIGTRIPKYITLLVREAGLLLYILVKCPI